MNDKQFIEIKIVSSIILILIGLLISIFLIDWSYHSMTYGILPDNHFQRLFYDAFWSFGITGYGIYKLLITLASRGLKTIKNPGVLE